MVRSAGVAADKEDRLFVKNGRRHYRPRYSMTEVRIGAVILVGLGLILAWVIYRGAHPDPDLFKESPGLVNRGKKAVDRGPVPKGLAPKGWKEGEISTFGPDNLYEKIDGREGYYKSFGFVRLWFVSMTEEGASAATAGTIDVELYDLGKTENALGAFSGELPESATAAIDAGGLVAEDRNALFVARGKMYVRAIGSDEGEATKEALHNLRKVLTGELEAGALPGSFGLFVKLGIRPGKISFVPENAFSFGFAENVHVGLMPDGETELFVVAAADDEKAKALADQFRTGFLQYGNPAEGVWVEDRYLGRISGAKSTTDIVFGVRSAADAKTAGALADRLEEAVKALPPGALEAGPHPEGGVDEH